MIISGTLPLNAFIACLHLLLAAGSIFVLKIAYRPLTRFIKQSHRIKQKKNKTEKTEEINYDRMLAIAFMKKYTLLGGFWQEDKKYMLKQFLFVSAFAVSCLEINHVILWPCSLSVFLLIVTFLLWEVLLKGIENKIKDQTESKINIQQKGESQIEIDFNHLQTKINIIPAVNKDLAKLETKKKRNIYELVLVTVVGFASVIMLMHTFMVLSTSISNSGQLNIISLLLAVTIDQLGVRPTVGLSIWSACKIYISISQQSSKQIVETNYFIALLCYEQLTDTRIQEQKARLKKQREMIISPPRKKTNSPSRVPKANISAQRQKFLNLLNLEPTVRNPDDENIDEIILTSAQKDLFEFEANNKEESSGYYTRRLRNRENGDIHSFSANNKGTTIDMHEKKDVEDFVVIKDNPFNELENIPSGEFFLEDSIIRKTKRRGYKKRAKRNLKLTGNSPYLEYLPDMLKKVEQFKNMGGATAPAREKKIL